MKFLQLFVLLSLAFITANSQAAVTEKDLNYAVDGKSFKGYVVYDSSIKGPRPGIIVVHEWWGHNDYARKRARMLAKLGYTAIALDMYGDGKQASHPGDAGKFSSVLKKNLPLAEKRFMAAYHLLQQQPQTDSKNIGAIGYCFGGGIVLAMARRGVDLKAVASFHGGLGLGAPVKNKIDSRILVLNGAADPFVKPEQIAAFKKEMRTAGIEFEFINYPGAKHAFTNPDADNFGKKFKIPLAYNQQADERSWQKMKTFLKQSFRE